MSNIFRSIGLNFGELTKIKDYILRNYLIVINKLEYKLTTYQTNHSKLATYFESNFELSNRIKFQYNFQQKRFT